MYFRENRVLSLESRLQFCLYDHTFCLYSQLCTKDVENLHDLKRIFPEAQAFIKVIVTQFHSETLKSCTKLGEQASILFI